ncbi:hypothetical protein GSI_03746 [Ganoderma sinense ZZ0214-1]|uniref:HMG box domain-containing protein n=1 Tax=Ganoderma sinense ZZ0214-1 TaxID=1077348 RepID=A0A2G8SJX1_9APHY|nr:hypothetical protein GSI_03746 [Ganoderma sinense ZZ0214-1]
MPKAPSFRDPDDDSKPDRNRIPRPPNAWILYRGDRLGEWKAARSPNDPPVKQADISRLIGKRWREEDDAIKLQYEKRAAIAKADHKKRYPDYKYNPVSREVKEKIRAEEKEAKKRAREEAKAARNAPPRPSLGRSREPSYHSPPSGSNVKLENMDSPSADQADAETDAGDEPRVVDPIDRGCGPSPPIDYDPQSPSSSSISSSSAYSSSSLVSAHSSPLPTPSQLSPAPFDASQTWQPPAPSPLSSSPTQPPPPAYPSTFVHSPAPSRQTSYNLLPSSSSTPSESPPSYSDGENWQPGPPDSAYDPYTPLPGLQSNWNTPSQDPLLLPQDVSDVNFSLPQFDPLLALSQDDQLNVGSASAGAIFDLSASAPNMGSANSPPGELELDISAFSQHFPVVGQQPAHHPPADELMAVLDMPELHETMEDRAAEAGAPAPGVAQASSLEYFAAFVNSHPSDALSLADPNFYANLGRQIIEHYPLLAASLFPQSMGMAPPQYIANANANVFAADNFTPIQQQQQPQDQAFDASMYQMFMQQPELAMPTPMRPIAVTDISTNPTPVQTEPSYTYPQAAAPLAQPASAPVATAPAPAPSAEAAPPRYVPPGGAGMVGRRRVARTYNMPRVSHPSDSE